jgi:FHS family glucose/mannose:H+ symporter-like MFS transporter
MPNLRIKISIFLNYFLFAILLNSVGTVILQVQHYFGVLESSAAILEGFKDFSIALASFTIASFINRIGYRKSMLLALAIMACTCFVIPLIKTFLAIKLLFAITGICFALIRVSVFIDDRNASSGNWFKAYYVLSALSGLAFLWLLISPLNESASKPEKSLKMKDEFAGMLKLIVLPIVLSFVICAFFSVLLEQSIMSWLPTFNNKVLQLSASVSVLIASILPASYALGRFLAGIVMKKFNWFAVLVTCLLAAACLVLIALPLAKSTDGLGIMTWFGIPVAAYTFPLIGFFLAPIYPAINSIVLSSLPKSRHGAMAGLIGLFSALGGTLGSIVTGNIFQRYGGQTAFYFSLIPIAILITALYIFKKTGNRVSASLDNKFLAVDYGVGSN